MRVVDIYYVAGILEGEACFGLTNNGKCPCIWLAMTDSDVIYKVRDLIDRSETITVTIDSRKSTYKDQYRLTLNGQRAAEWMMTIYPLMSIRRKAKIKECLLAWRNSVTESKYVNDAKAKAKSKLTRWLNKSGYSEEAINFAKRMKNFNFSNEEIMQSLEQAKVKRLS